MAREPRFSSLEYDDELRDDVDAADRDRVEVGEEGCCEGRRPADDDDSGLDEAGSDSDGKWTEGARTC